MQCVLGKFKLILALAILTPADSLLAAVPPPPTCTGTPLTNCYMVERSFSNFRIGPHTINVNTCVKRYEVRNGKGYVCEYSGDDKEVRFCFSRIPQAECTPP